MRVRGTSGSVGANGSADDEETRVFPVFQRRMPMAAVVTTAKVASTRPARDAGCIGGEGA